MYSCCEYLMKTAGEYAIIERRKSARVTPGNRKDNGQPDLRKESDRMKKTLIGGILTLAGSIWALAILTAAGNNLVNGWDTSLGRFWSTVVDMNLVFLFVLSCIVTVFGIVVLLVELFRKEK